MIIGAGIDIIEIDRITNAIERYGNSFLKRVYTKREREYCMAKHNRNLSYESFATRFAAKEAVFKGLGFSDIGMRWLNIEVLSNNSGKPTVKLHGSYSKHSQMLRVSSILLSLSHSRKYAVANAIILQNDS